jgi:exopolysaccharide biosynthesis polyprenyl glycosylphosphotransferase
VSAVAEREAALRLPGVEHVHYLDPRTARLIARRRTSARRLRRGWVVRRTLLAADLVGLTLAFAISSVAERRAPSTDHLALLPEFAFFVVALPVWVALAKLYGLYERDEEKADHSTVDDFLGVFHLVTVGVWIFFLATWATGLVHPPLTRLVLLWALAVPLVTTFRATARAVCRRGIAYLQNTVIVGAGDVGQTVAKKILAHPEYGLNIVGFVDAQPKIRDDALDHLTIVGGTENLPQIIELLDVERVIIAFSNDRAEDTLDLIRRIKDLDVQIDIVPRLFEVVGANISLHSVEGVPLVGLPPLRLSRSSRLLKRSVDVVLSAVGLFVLMPLLTAVAIAIKLDSRGPIFFRQTRMGAEEHSFRIFKFRTMIANAEQEKATVAHLNMHARPGGDARMFKIPNDPRITRIGSMLRRTRIDELPQLINVLRGEMSLVGPRPLILEEDCHIVDWGRKRLNLRPGVTGLWQVLGASDIPFDEMVKLDYLYVTNWSLAEDMRLILKTFGAILRPRQAF